MNYNILSAYFVRMGNYDFENYKNRRRASILFFTFFKERLGGRLEIFRILTVYWRPQCAESIFFLDFQEFGQKKFCNLFNLRVFKSSPEQRI